MDFANIFSAFCFVYRVGLFCFLSLPLMGLSMPVVAANRTDKRGKLNSSSVFDPLIPRTGVNFLSNRTHHFPNHWWRGGVALGFEAYLSQNFGLLAFVAHESIHPTAGLVSSPSDALPGLDGTWRTIEYNQASLQAFINYESLTGNFGPIFYFASRNKPEVELQHNNKKDSTWGLALA